MKRSDFLKRLGFGLGAAIVAPTVLADDKMKAYHETPKTEDYAKKKLEDISGCVSTVCMPALDFDMAQRMVFWRKI